MRTPDGTSASPLPLFGKATGRHAMRNRDSNALVRRLNAFANLTVKSGLQNRFRVSDSNSVLELAIADLLSEVGELIRCAVVTFTEDDVLTCTVSGGERNGEAINVAKPAHLRKSYTSETIQGLAITYAYASAIQRTATAATVATTQYMMRDYQVGDIIYALPAVTGVTYSGVTVEYLDLNLEGRCWAVYHFYKDYNDGCAEKKILTPASVIQAV